MSRSAAAFPEGGEGPSFFEKKASPDVAIGNVAFLDLWNFVTRTLE
jgi:hypothetical protein